jgi:NAD-dependent dihydropyrimidine dehydrogenase PreA subunit
MVLFPKIHLITHDRGTTMSDDAIYQRLRKHLDKQPVGFPSTRGGSEIRILKHVFSPEEATVALTMSHRFESADTIYRKMRDPSISIQDVENRLESALVKGGILSRLSEGVRHYALAPLVVGIYELQNQRLTPEFIRDFSEYTGSISFGIEFLSTDIPQMRTIPISEGITLPRHVFAYDDIDRIMNDADEPFAVLECICRKKKHLEGAPCQKTQRQESCLAMGNMAENALYMGIARQISRSEARDILRKNQEDGLVLQPSNTLNVDFICSCCKCCCGMLETHRSIPDPSHFWASNYRCRVSMERCNGCGKCVRRCQVDAVTVNDSSKKAIVDPSQCIGCGVCLPTCPTGALSLEKNSFEHKPPKDLDDLYDTILKHKKGPAGKMGVLAKLVVDALKKRRLDLLLKK